MKYLNQAGVATIGDCAAVSPGFFGDGWDQEVTLNGTNTYTGMSKTGNIYTLNRSFFCKNLTLLNSGITLITYGYKIFCTGTVVNNGTIHNSGSTGAIGGAGGVGYAGLPGPIVPDGDVGGGGRGGNRRHRGQCGRRGIRSGRRRSKPFDGRHRRERRNRRNRYLF